MVRVSVVIPVHNRRDMVVEALESVLAQSYRHFEIVVSDDGSTDRTPAQVFATLGAEPRAIEILEQMNPGSIRPFGHVFSHGENTIQYHYSHNRGLSAARNRGVRHARGYYVAFLEAEDLWDPTHLETHMAFLDSHPDAYISHVAERPAKGGRRGRRAHKTPPSSGWIFEQALTAAPVTISSAVVHRSCFNECGFFDENLPACEDYDLWLRLAARHPIHFLDGGVAVTRRSTRLDSPSRGWSWERFRVYALEKAFQGGQLDAEQRLLVAQEIVRKCERLVEGFRRQKSDERSNFYERKRRRFAQEVRKLRASQIAQRPRPDPAGVLT
ncbi:MAG: glycosyltransferase family 2 protein [Candidatus Eisenbacteria sp.]|nr:glycosyltransferase family 2 protein [Candidatus Eisenbacteria bacterium]